MNRTNTLERDTKAVFQSAGRVLIMSAGVLLAAMAGTAAASVPDAPELGPMGGAEGQVLRLNVMAIDGDRSFIVSRRQREIAEPGPSHRRAPRPARHAKREQPPRFTSVHRGELARFESSLEQ